MPDTATIKQLLEAGAHFGHQTGRWHPRMKNYIFTKRNGIHIIDLEKTAVDQEETCKLFEVGFEHVTDMDGKMQLYSNQPKLL